jgi:hypothetical protein
LSAAADGVRTVDATAGLTNAKIQEITKILNNNEMEDNEIEGSVIAITGNEKAKLMDDDKFIQYNYGGANNLRLNAGTIKNFGLYDLVSFAGNETGAGSAIVPIPMIPEDSTSGTRDCVVLTPQSILCAYQITRIGITEVNDRVNSQSIDIDLIIKSMRREGKRVVKLKTTI